jgi:hypothetical protein
MEVNAAPLAQKLLHLMDGLVIAHWFAGAAIGAIFANGKSPVAPTYNHINRTCDYAVAHP